MAEPPNFGSFDRQLVGWVCRILTEIGHDYGAEAALILVNPADPSERLLLANTSPDRVLAQIQVLAGGTELADFVSLSGHQKPS